MPGPTGPQGATGPQGPPTTPSATTPIMDGTGTVGVATTYARGDHQHPVDSSRYAASNPSGFVTAAQATSAAPVQSVATRTGAIVLTHADLTDWAATLQPYALSAGITNASNAAAGMVGEQLAVSVTTAVNLTTTVTANVGTLALTAGDWVVAGAIVFNPAQGPTALGAAVTTTSATLPTAAHIASGTGNMTQYRMTFGNGMTQTMQTGPTRVNVTATTNVYLAAQGTFNSTCTATGYMSARRVR